MVSSTITVEVDAVCLLDLPCAAIMFDAVGDVVVMDHKKENKQHQHCTDPKNDHSVQGVAFFSHWRYSQEGTESKKGWARLNLN